MSRIARALISSLLPCLSYAVCIPFNQARNHLGETQCVSGRVIRVEEGSRGVHYLDFCEDYRFCSFSVVVFPHGLKSVGDARQLAGKVVEIRGELKEYDNRAEIILESSKQLGGGSARLSPLPKSFDVEERGHFSAGKFRAPRSRTSRKRKDVRLRPRTFRRMWSQVEVCSAKNQRGHREPPRALGEPTRLD